MHTFGSRLRALRVARGLTQRQLAEKSGAHHVTICRWEHFDSYPQAATTASAEKLAVALETSAAWLMFGEGASPLQESA